MTPPTDLTALSQVLERAERACRDDNTDAALDYVRDALRLVTALPREAPPALVALVRELKRTQALYEDGVTPAIEADAQNGDAIDALPAYPLPDAAPAPEGEAAQAHGYLSRLLTHYAPQCEPLPDLMGLCSQIDNLIVGMAAPPAAAPRQGTCPTCGADSPDGNIWCSDGFHAPAWTKAVSVPPPPVEDDGDSYETCESCEQPITGQVVRTRDDVPLCEACAAELAVGQRRKET